MAPAALDFSMLGHEERRLNTEKVGRILRVQRHPKREGCTPPSPQRRCDYITSLYASGESSLERALFAEPVGRIRRAVSVPNVLRMSQKVDVDSFQGVRASTAIATSVTDVSLSPNVVRDTSTVKGSADDAIAML
ncbi:hypothetical protein MRX96_044251 [Rhipicephalus microplus]